MIVFTASRSACPSRERSRIPTSHSALNPIAVANSMGPIGYDAATALAIVNVWLSLATHAALAVLFALSKKPSRTARAKAS